LRHRYLAASRVGVSPVILSQRLVEHWGVGQLLLAPPALPPVPQQLPLPMPTLLQQEIMMNTITAPNITVVVAGGGGSEQEKGRDDHEHVMLPEHVVPPLVEKKTTVPASGTGTWNQFERIQFLLALEQHGPGDWSKIMPLIPTR
jgi:hypothetical protein